MMLNVRALDDVGNGLEAKGGLRLRLRLYFGELDLQRTLDDLGRCNALLKKNEKTFLKCSKFFFGALKNFFAQNF